MSARGPDLDAPGLYHYTQLQGDFPVRFHLRIDPDGGGLLLANASEAAHLSPVGVAMVRGALEGLDDTELIQQVRADFAGGSVAQVTHDLEAVRKLLADLLTPEDNYPITNFSGAEAPPEKRRLRAPYQAYVTQGEPGTVETVLRKLWDAGVPQATLLAQLGLPPEGLVRLVECAEDLGMIAGIRTLAGWLSEGVLRDAGMAGLDFLELVLVSAEAAEHDALTGPGDHEAFLRAVAACHDMELCPMAQVPLTSRNADDLPEIVAFAAEQAIRNLDFVALACPDADAEQSPGALPARALPQVATAVTECAEECGARFLWAPPVRFDVRKTLADHVIAGPRAGADASIRVEADGTVYAPRGPREPCGNLLRQSWDAVWKHPAFTRYRDLVEAPSRCPTCPGLALCAAACPKDPTGWSDDTVTGEAG